MSACHELIMSSTTYYCIVLDSQIRLVVGAANKAILQQANAKRARLVVVRSGKSFREQDSADSDAETIGQLIEVRFGENGQGHDQGRG